MKSKVWGKNRKMRRECYYCGAKITYKQATVDHVVARARGGTDQRQNLKIACKPCNQRKGSKALVKFVRQIGKTDYIRVTAKPVSLPPLVKSTRYAHIKPSRKGR